MTELKPCPFCGGEAMHWGGAGQHCIRCKSCFNTNEKLVGGTLYDAFETSEEAAKDWNTRKPMERIIKKLEQKQKIHKEIYDKNEEELEWTVSYINSCERIKDVQGTAIEAYDYCLGVVKEEGGIDG